MTVIMPRYDSDTIPVCLNCENSEAPMNVHKMCLKCGVAYCVHYASEVDIRFCGNCLSDFRVIESIEIKTVERVASDGEVVSRKRQTARNIRLEGMDWLFQAQKISTMTDEDILNAIEYHSAIKSLLINEREERKVEHFKKLQGIRITARADTAPVVSGKRTRTKVEKKTPDANAVAAALGTILKANIDPAMLAEALAKLKK